MNPLFSIGFVLHPRGMWRKFQAALLSLATCLLVLPVPADVGPSEVEPEFSVQTVDAEQFEELAADQGIATRLAEPGLALYVQETTFRLSNRLADWAGGWFRELFRFVGSGGVWFLRVLFVALGALVFVLLVRALVTRRRRRGVAEPVVTLREPEGVPREKEERWEDTLNRHLEEGAGAEAATALWWLLASRLVPEGVEGAWTSRELLQRAGRGDLRPGFQSLDRLLYGVSEPTSGEVAGLWHELRESLE